MIKDTINDASTDYLFTKIYKMFTDGASRTELAQSEHNLLNSTTFTVSEDIAVAGIYKRFSCLPLHELSQRSHSFQQIKNMPPVTIQLPDNNHEWLEALAGHLDYNPILLMMLADLCNAE